MNTSCPATLPALREGDDPSLRMVEFNLTIGLNQYLPEDDECDTWVGARPPWETPGFRRAIRDFFGMLTAGERTSVLSLADHLARMTHAPEPMAETEPAPVPGELREMIDRALWEKSRLIAEYPSRIASAGARANARLQTLLERQLADEIRHQAELVRELAGLNDSGFLQTASDGPA